jgi:hypothetical protein
MAVAIGSNVIGGALKRTWRIGTAPVSGVSGTLVNIADVGDLLTRTDNGLAYVNTGSKSSPTWTIVGSQI